MRTVKEISDLQVSAFARFTIMVAIGLLKPTEKVMRDTGFMTIRHWKHYTDLFFREFDISSNK